MDIMIAVPCMDHILTPFASALIELDKPEGTVIQFQQNSLIYDSRNLLFLKAEQEGFDAILWLDSDMLFPKHTLLNLAADMVYGKYDLVTGLYFKRTFPTKPVIYSRLEHPTKDENGNIVHGMTEYMDYPSDAVFPIEGCGFGCVLTTVDLIKRVWDKYGPAFAPFNWCGEDVSFCLRAKSIGARMVCDSRISAGHIGIFNYNEHLYRKKEEPTT